MNQDIKLILTEYGEVDVYIDRSKSFGIPLIFQSTDVSDITKRKSNFSKSIVIPGTQKNNKIFSQAYEITKYGGFNATIKHPCVLLVNDSPTIKGYMLLNGINKLKIGDGYQIDYSINIYDDVSNLFSVLKNKKLTTLDFSSGFTFTSYLGDKTITTDYRQGDHTFNETNVLNSYIHNVYKYPIVNYAWNDLLYRPTFQNYPYNAVSLGFLYPAVRIKAIFDRIFYEAGYTYESGFINDYTGQTYGSGFYDISGLFHRLLNIYNGDEKLTEKIYFNYSVENWTHPTEEHYWFYLPLGNGRDNVWDVSTYVHDPHRTYSKSYNSNSVEVGDFIIKNTIPSYYNNNGEKEPIIYIPEDGDYEVEIYLDVAQDQGGTVKMGQQWTTISGCTTYDLRVENDTKRRTQVGGQWTDEGLVNATEDDLPYPAGGGDYDDASLNIHLNAHDMGCAYNQSYDGDTSYVWTSGFTFSGKKGDALYFQVNLGYILSIHFFFETQIIEFIDNYEINEFRIKLKEKITDDKFIDKYNSGITLSNYLPDINQDEFVKNIFTMFNLYARYDNYNDKLIHIESFNDFYKQGTIQNWSDKVDYSEKIEISTLTDKLKHNYIYTYADGDDYYNTLFKSINGYNYGVKVVSIDNQYLNDEQIIDNKYQSFVSYFTIPEGVSKTITELGYVPYSSITGNTYVSVPAIYKDINSNPFYEKETTSPLMGAYSINAYTYLSGGTYYQGHYFKLIDNIITEDPSNITMFQEVAFHSIPKVQDYNDDGFTGTIYSYNKLDEGAYSLKYSSDYGFYQDSRTPYIYASYEYLYPEYHENQLQNIIDPDAREVELKANLAINDIIRLDFRNKLFIDGQNYLLEKINFDPTSPETSKVLLLKEI